MSSYAEGKGRGRLQITVLTFTTAGVGACTYLLQIFSFLSCILVAFLKGFGYYMFVFH